MFLQIREDFAHKKTGSFTSETSGFHIPMIFHYFSFVSIIFMISSMKVLTSLNSRYTDAKRT